MMDNLTYSLIAPSPFALAIGVAGGTAFGIIGGIANHEFVDLRSGFKCVLRSVIVSATVSAIASAVWAVFVLTAMNTGAVTFTLIIAGCLLTNLEFLNGSSKKTKISPIIYSD